MGKKSVDYSGPTIGSLHSPVILLPMFCPRMCKIDNEHELNKNEEKSSSEPKVHPSRSETSMRDEERAHSAKKQNLNNKVSDMYTLVDSYSELGSPLYRGSIVSNSGLLLQFTFN